MHVTRVCQNYLISIHVNNNIYKFSAVHTIISHVVNYTMNSLTSKLIDCKAACYIDMQCINHVLYANDICLIAPTATAM